MKIVLIALSLSVSYGVIGQTKKISARSHSQDLDQLTIRESGNIGIYIEYKPESTQSQLKIDTLTRKVMVYDSVSTYKFIMEKKKSKGHRIKVSGNAVPETVKKK